VTNAGAVHDIEAHIRLAVLTASLAKLAVSISKASLRRLLRFDEGSIKLDSDDRYCMIARSACPQLSETNEPAIDDRLHRKRCQAARAPQIPRTAVDLCPILTVHGTLHDPRFHSQLIWSECLIMRWANANGLEIPANPIRWFAARRDGEW
jgi:hypothetical protein